MKTYRVIRPEFIRINELGIEESIDNDGILDLVNIEDDQDRILANPDDFFEGQEFWEDEFRVEECSYIDEQGNLGTTPFAFKLD